jgi:hypothetical protein
VYFRRTQADRAAVLQLLAARGPVAGADAAGQLGWPRERWWAALWIIRACWDVTGKGLVLTPAGRKAAAKLP